MFSFDGSVALAIAPAIAALIGGTAASYTYEPRSTLGWRAATGACTGLAALGLIGFALAMRMGLTILTLLLSSVIVLSPALVFLSARYRRAFMADVRPTSFAELRTRLRGSPGFFVIRTVLCLVALFVLWRIADRAFFVRENGLYTGIAHNLGDLPFHLSIINRFAAGGNFPPEHPSFAGAGFTYPFLTDFVSAMFVRAGLDVRTVVVWSTLLLLMTLALLMFRWTMDLTGDRTAALIAPAVMFLSGGLGWWVFLQEGAQFESTIWERLARPPHDYTITPDNEFRWGNIITTLLVPQRGLLLGLPLALIVFDNWWHASTEDVSTPQPRHARMIAAGVIAGLLPLVHAHTFAVVLGIGGCLGLLSRRRDWMLFVAWALALGLPQVLWLARSSGINTGSFVEWSVGWDHGTQNVLVFWLKNAGVFLPLVIVALLWRGARPLLPRRLLAAYLPFTLCFIVPNLLRLAPWIWDNIKILIYWYVASVPIVALLLARVAHGAFWRTAAGAVLFLSLTLAGGLDLWRVASRSIELQVFDREGIEFAAVVARVTPRRALILHAPIYNHPIILSARRSFMGYPGHVWSHGLNGRSREADIKRMFLGSADATALFSRYGIDYAVVGPAEREQFPLNVAFFERYPLVGEAGEYRLYRVSAQD